MEKQIELLKEHIANGNIFMAQLLTGMIESNYGVKIELIKEGE
jgi:hypothetical protein